MKLDARNLDIAEACQRGSELARASGRSVEFEIRGISVVAVPGERAESLQRRWSKEFDTAAILKPGGDSLETLIRES